MIEFRPLKPTDAPVLHRWFSDYEVVKYSLTRFLLPMSLAEVEERIKVEYKTTERNYTVGIADTQTKKLIGYAGLAGISTQNKSAEYFIMIGDRSYWSKGVGTQVTRRIVEYGFNKLNLHRIQLTVSNVNPAGVKAYENAGFIIEGVMRDASFRDGKFHNKIMMAIIETNWKK